MPPNLENDLNFRVIQIDSIFVALSCQIAQPMLPRLGARKSLIKRSMAVGLAWMGTFLRLRDICVPLVAKARASDDLRNVAPPCS